MIYLNVNLLLLESQGILFSGLRM